jgi:type I restriction enzyme, S subunit
LTPQIRRVATLLSGSGFPPIEQNQVGEDLPFFKVGDLASASADGMLQTPASSISKQTASRLRASVIPPGSTILPKIGAALFGNRRAMTTVPCCIDNNLLAVVPGQSLSPRFCFYLLSAVDAARYAHPGPVPSLDVAALAEAALFRPSIRDQSAIIDFLDRETTRIDALIAGKKRMVELSEERRVAVIEDLLIGRDWPMIPLSRTIRRIEQGWSPQCDDRLPAETEWGVLKVGCVNRGVFRRDEVKALPAEMAPRTNYEVQDGDFLVSRANTRDLVGSAAIVSGVRPRTLLCDKLYRLTLDTERLLPRFACLCLQTRAARDQIELDATGASDSMQNVGQDTIGNLKLPLPGLDAQAALVNSCDAERERIENVIIRIQNQIILLRERRHALVTGVVTGQKTLQAAA